MPLVRVELFERRLTPELEAQLIDRLTETLLETLEAPELRPLGVGDVLDRTFNVYRAKPLLFIGLSAIWYLVLVLVFIVLAVAVFAGALATFARQANNPGSPLAASPELLSGAVVGIIGFVIVGVVLAILLFSAQSAALVDAGSRRYLSKEASIGESFRAGISAAGRLFVAGILAFLAILALWAVVFIVAGIIAAVAQGEELDGVAGAEFLGEAVCLGAGDELEAEGLEADDLGVGLVEGRQHFVVA